MSAASHRDAARARTELAVHRQLSALWSKAVSLAALADQGVMSDADRLAAYQRDRDKAITVAARVILGRAGDWVGFAEQAATVADGRTGRVA